MPIECNKLISRLDEKRCVKHKLYKYHIDYEVKRKEVEKIGRNLDRVILLDTTESVKTDNLLLINGWKGESNDAVLA
jgi:TFIIF-interacting CTD phosphatase-like protein